MGILSKNVKTYYVNNFFGGLQNNIDSLLIPDNGLQGIDSFINTKGVSGGFDKTNIVFRYPLYPQGPSLYELPLVGFYDIGKYFVYISPEYYIPSNLHRIYLVEKYTNNLILFPLEFYNYTLTGLTIYNRFFQFGEDVYCYRVCYDTYSSPQKVIFELMGVCSINGGRPRNENKVVIKADLYASGESYYNLKCILYKNFFICFINNLMKWSNYGDIMNFTEGYAGEAIILKPGEKILDLVVLYDDLYLVSSSGIYRINFAGYPTIWNVQKVVDFKLEDNNDYPYLIPYIDGYNYNCYEYIRPDTTLVKKIDNVIYICSWFNKTIYKFDGNNLVDLCIKVDKSTLFNSFNNIIYFDALDKSLCFFLYNSTKQVFYNSILENVGNFSSSDLFTYVRYWRQTHNVDKIYAGIITNKNIDINENDKYVYIHSDKTFYELGKVKKPVVYLKTKKFSFVGSGEDAWWLNKRLLRLELIADSFSNKTYMIKINDKVFNTSKLVVDTNIISKTFEIELSNFDGILKGIKLYYTLQGTV